MYEFASPCNHSCFVAMTAKEVEEEEEEEEGGY